MTTISTCFTGTASKAGIQWPRCRPFYLGEMWKARSGRSLQKGSKRGHISPVPWNSRSIFHHFPIIFPDFPWIPFFGCSKIFRPDTETPLLQVQKFRWHMRHRAQLRREKLGDAFLQDSRHAKVTWPNSAMNEIYCDQKTPGDELKLRWDGMDVKKNGLITW